MTFLWTLLTFFVEGQPNVPTPVTAGAITVDGEFAEEVSVGESFNRPRITPPTWHGSPSWMVAAPPVKPAPFDVFSPAVRPPQEFPGLFPCPPVELVACPAPEPCEEPPAVRHVSFAGHGVDVRLAKNEPRSQPACPAPAACPTSPTSPTAFNGSWKKLHAHQHAPSHPPSPYAGPHFPPPRPAHPVAFLQPTVMGAVCPAGSTCAVGHPGSPFPGAKKVRHVVSATYDVPHQTAAALERILEKSEGVLGCLVEGDELTVTAQPPAQAAIAQFLATVVTNNQTTDQPARVIDVKTTKSQCCNSECDCKKCECNCQCCGSKKKTEPVAWYKKYLMSEKAKAIERNLGIETVTPCTKATQCSATAECAPAASCPAPGETRAVVQLKSSQTKPLQIRIIATSEGVQLRTSDGTTLEAKQIHLETDGIRKLKSEGNADFAKPKAQPAAAKSVPSRLPTY